MRRRVAASLLGLSLLFPVQPALASNENSIDGAPIVGNQAIVRIDESTEHPGEILDELGYTVIQSLGEESDRTFVVELNPFVSTSSQISRLDANSGVVFAEPNYQLKTATTPSDPSFVDGSMWGMGGANTSSPSQFDSNAAAACAPGYTSEAQAVVCTAVPS